LQYSWREQRKLQEEKLGAELLMEGEINEANLQRALEMHSRANKPLGQVLVESKSCSPESVINTLVKRDERRRYAFTQFLKENMTIAKPPQAPAQQPGRQNSSDGDSKSSIVEKISAFFRKPT
jgi:hypothetical protein